MKIWCLNKTWFKCTIWDPKKKNKAKIRVFKIKWYSQTARPQINWIQINKTVKKALRSLNLKIMKLKLLSSKPMLYSNTPMAVGLWPKKLLFCDGKLKKNGMQTICSTLLWSLPAMLHLKNNLAMRQVRKFCISK